MEPIHTAHEHQLKLIRVEALVSKHYLSNKEELELNQLVNVIQAYESVHYPVPSITDVVVNQIKWNKPVGDIPDDWIERWATIGFYTLRVWFSSRASFRLIVGYEPIVS